MLIFYNLANHTNDLRPAPPMFSPNVLSSRIQSRSGHCETPLFNQNERIKMNLNSKTPHIWSKRVQNRSKNGKTNKPSRTDRVCIQIENQKDIPRLLAEFKIQPRLKHEPDPNQKSRERKRRGLGRAFPPYDPRPAGGGGWSRRRGRGGLVGPVPHWAWARLERAPLAGSWWRGDEVEAEMRGEEMPDCEGGDPKTKLHTKSYTRLHTSFNQKWNCVPESTRSKHDSIQVSIYKRKK
jgi:hypothetical protein